MDTWEYIKEKFYPLIKPHSAIIGVIWIVKTLLLIFRAAYRGFKLFVWPYIRKLDFIKLYGEYVIITAACEGIGFEFAKQFLKRGHSVVLIDTNSDDLNRAKDELE
ncbi:hydroxysteroid dehydrogenase-like protein 3, partial [Leptotrombidium deliense]